MLLTGLLPVPHCVTRPLAACLHVLGAVCRVQLALQRASAGSTSPVLTAPQRAGAGRPWVAVILTTWLAG